MSEKGADSQGFAKLLAKEMSTQGPASAGFCVSTTIPQQTFCIFYDSVRIKEDCSKCWRRLYSHFNLDIIFGANTRRQHWAQS